MEAPEGRDACSLLSAGAHNSAESGHRHVPFKTQLREKEQGRLWLQTLFEA